MQIQMSVLVFNRDKLQYLKTSSSNVSELSGTSQDTYKLFQLLETSPKQEYDTFHKGLWANDSISLITAETPMYKLTGLPSHWYASTNTLQQIIQNECVEISW